MYLQVQFREFLLVLPFAVLYSAANIRSPTPDPITARGPEAITAGLGLSNGK